MKSPAYQVSVSDRLSQLGFTNPRSTRPIMTDLDPNIFDPFLLKKQAVTVTINRRPLEVTMVDVFSESITKEQVDFYVEGLYKGRRVRAYFLASKGRLSEIYIQTR